MNQDEDTIGLVQSDDPPRKEVKDNSYVDKFFMDAINAKDSQHLLPWEPTKRMLRGVGKNKPSVRKRILIQMRDFYNENDLIPIDPSLQFNMGKYFGKWSIVFSSTDIDKQLIIPL